MSPEALARLSSILDLALEIPDAAREAWRAERSDAQAAQTPTHGLSGSAATPRTSR